MLEVAHRIERGITEQSEHIRMFATDVEALHKLVDGNIAGIVIVDVATQYATAGQRECSYAMTNGNAAYRVSSYKRAAARTVVIVATLHQRALHATIAHAHIYRDGCVHVGEHVARHSIVFEFRSFHIRQPFACY